MQRKSAKNSPQSKYFFILSILSFAFGCAFGCAFSGCFYKPIFTTGHKENSMPMQQRVIEGGIDITPFELASADYTVIDSIEFSIGYRHNTVLDSTWIHLVAPNGEFKNLHLRTLQSSSHGGGKIAMRNIYALQNFERIYPGDVVEFYFRFHEFTDLTQDIIVKDDYQIYSH